MDDIFNLASIINPKKKDKPTGSDIYIHKLNEEPNPY